MTTFDSVSTSSAILYVPIGTKSAYQAADVCRNFTNIEEMNFGSNGDINCDEIVSVTDTQSVVDIILNV